ncbi:hypothetical protein NHU85_11610 [Edwardsiella tarda]|uniref:hypothetical protein n=1 Tax=Edwardsiella tarda TaxID=636 RepID=UPI00266F096C|nr:hypothetical protein [Edwardsiella tarda]WKS80392.1 hypothetical protein NHU85_11610 [Edwardsiella tarda]
MVKGWKFLNYNGSDWELSDVTDGNYVGFVYLIVFPLSDEFYIGMKQIYKGVKNVNKLKPESIESNWVEYTSSSTTVNRKIANGEKYEKYILWCFPTIAATAFCESFLICNFACDPACLNQSIMIKTKIAKSRDFGLINNNLYYLIRSKVYGYE